MSAYYSLNDQQDFRKINMNVKVSITLKEPISAIGPKNEVHKVE